MNHSLVLGIFVLKRHQEIRRFLTLYKVTCPHCGFQSYTNVPKHNRCDVSTFRFWSRDDVVTEFSLKQFSSSTDVTPAINRITQKGGLSHVGEWGTPSRTEKELSRGFTCFQIRSKSALGTVVNYRAGATLWCFCVRWPNAWGLSNLEIWSHGLCYR